MRGLRSALAIGLVTAGVIALARLTLEAQDRVGQPKVEGLVEVGGKKGGADESAQGSGAPASVVEALERPFVLPFAEPTQLDEVCRHLGRVLRRQWSSIAPRSSASNYAPTTRSSLNSTVCGSRRA